VKKLWIIFYFIFIQKIIFNYYWTFDTRFQDVYVVSSCQLFGHAVLALRLTTIVIVNILNIRISGRQTIKNTWCNRVNFHN
ncbi:hypothetical protein BY996DRAFT_7717234, partial [Phakopsora pachyrhizi]